MLLKIKPTANDNFLQLLLALELSTLQLAHLTVQETTIRAAWMFLQSPVLTTASLQPPWYLPYPRQFHFPNWNKSEQANAAKPMAKSHPHASGENWSSEAGAKCCWMDTKLWPDPTLLPKEFLQILPHELQPRFPMPCPAGEKFNQVFELSWYQLSNFH